MKAHRTTASSIVATFADARLTFAHAAVFVLTVITAWGASGIAAQIRPALVELDAAKIWTAAKFESQTNLNLALPSASIEVVKNHDRVQFNARAGKPLRLTDGEHTKGLYCHAPSHLIVRLGGRGKSFQATVGVDSNDQTSGGRGSVHFVVMASGKELYRSPLLKEGMAPHQIAVPLDGASEIELIADDGGDGISCDQADWVDPVVTMADGGTGGTGIVSIGDLPVRGAPIDRSPAFSFKLDGKPSGDFLPAWKRSDTDLDAPAGKTRHATVFMDPATGLELRCVRVGYTDYPTVEWTLYLKNNGTGESPLITDFQSIDSSFDCGPGGQFVLHHNKGTFVRADDFEPLATEFGPGHSERFAPPGGRPCGHVWPYFNLEWGAEGAREGALVVVGWPGQWAATFTRDAGSKIRVVAGQEKVALRLHPGEEIRSPLMVLQFYRGDWLRAQNIWRRWMVEWNLPREDGHPARPLLTPCSSHQFAEMIQATEQTQITFIDRYLEEKLRIDYWWMDAGWYLNRSGWPDVGTWTVDTNRFPSGLRAITDHGRSKGVKSIVWFEPERVMTGTRIEREHPDWVLGKGDTRLFNLGDEAARVWLTEHIDSVIREQGIDLYRQDFNMDPLSFWRGADTQERQGATENHYVSGYLAFWDELLRRHPGMLIDSCASGGHRNDLETMRRSLPFLRSDCIFDPVGNQCHSYALALWLPYNGTGSAPRQFDLYALRSNMSCPKQTPCWDLRDPKLPYDVLRQAVSEWRSYADDYLGDFHPLTPYSLSQASWMAWQFDQPDKAKGVVQAFRRSESIYESARLTLANLDQAASYTITDLDHTTQLITASGKQLATEGLLVSIPARPGAAIYTYRRNDPAK